MWWGWGGFCSLPPVPRPFPLRNEEWDKTRWLSCVPPSWTQCPGAQPALWMHLQQMQGSLGFVLPSGQEAWFRKVRWSVFLWGVVDTCVRAYQVSRGGHRDGRCLMERREGRHNFPFVLLEVYHGSYLQHFYLGRFQVSDYRPTEGLWLGGGRTSQRATEILEGAGSLTPNTAQQELCRQGGACLWGECAGYGCIIRDMG